MKILYIHGYNGTPHGEKYNKLRQSFPEADILAPQHDSIPQNVFHLLDGFASGLDAHNDLIVGTSLGGFWANFFALRYGVRAVLLNPVVSPVKRLNFRDCSFAADYAAFENPDASQQRPPAIVLLAEDDDVLPYREALDHFSGACDVRVLKSGGHRMNDPISLDVLKVAIDDITHLSPE
ncbi:MAG: YqiA/YcfP family alpha/beta fold hydrolase [Verrucomicrobiota bacterium]